MCLRVLDKPLFRKSIAEPLNETSIIIQEEMHIEDRIANDAMSNKLVPEVPDQSCYQQLILS